MDNCVIRNTMNAENPTLYGVAEGVVYKAEDGEHKKGGATILRKNISGSFSFTACLPNIPLSMMESVGA